jgi:hypothetical protein
MQNVPKNVPKRIYQIFIYHQLFTILGICNAAMAQLVVAFDWLENDLFYNWVYTVNYLIAAFRNNGRKFQLNSRTRPLRVYHIAKSNAPCPPHS